MPHSADSSAEGSDLLTLSTRDSTISEFPTKTVKTTFSLPDRDTQHDSPAVTGFTFTDLEPLEQTNTRPISFGLDAFPRAVTPSAQPLEKEVKMTSTDASKRRTQYFEDSFAYKDGNGQSARERIQKDSPVVAELKTNVIVKDEFTVVTNLSQHLSERYRRPEAAIMINVTHSACLMMAGSFEPAYILTITAIPSELQPITNKRNAYLIQHFLADTLHVPSSRGVIRFQEIPEQKLGTNGSTVAGDIERLEKAQAEEINGLGRSMTSKSSRKSLIGEKRKSLLGRIEKQKNDDLERVSSVKSFKSTKSMTNMSTREQPLPSIPVQSKMNGDDKATTGTATALHLHRLSPITSTNGSTNGSMNGSTFSLAFETNKLPTRPQTANRPSSMSNAAQFSALNNRPASSRRHLSNITGNVRDFPRPPPIPVDDVVGPMTLNGGGKEGETPKMSKRKSFVAMFKRSDSTHKSATS